MIDTLKIYNQLKETLNEDSARVIVEIFKKIYDELQNNVTKTEFKELSEIVQNLAKAQKKTEERVEILTQRLDTLAQRVEELAEAQKKTEKRLNELAEAQKKTEKRLNELAEAQKKTEKRVNELAKAQKKTEETLNSLILEHKETRKQLGGLSHTVGYMLENEALKSLPKLLKQEHNINVKGKLVRRFLKDKDEQYLEVNILGKAQRNSKEFVIIGESKSQLSKKDIANFIRKRIERFKPVYRNILPIIVTHMISEPDVEEYAHKKGIIIFYSYEL